MADKTADFLLERLRAWNIHRVFGYPGDGINAIIGAFDRADGDPELIQVRHEEMAAFMACAHAKFTSEIGVCLATSGPGAIHLLNGLYDAKLDHQPVLAIVGQQALSALAKMAERNADRVAVDARRGADVEDEQRRCHHCPWGIIHRATFCATCAEAKFASRKNR